ncbi:MAG: glycosyltransferase family 2 protein [Planctomycetaceae bacterium]|nr:glycosyltransferase family 2 protein [Planctomycetaceae bacterium]
MFFLTILCSVCLTGFAVLYLFWGQKVANLYHIQRLQNSDREYTPRATVILPLRGNDPFLIDCLTGLLNQDYPQYAVKIIVDHLDDPAFSVVNQYLEEHSHPHCQVQLRERSSGACGLKNEALIQALNELDEATEVFAWLDSDVVPHRTWLRDLVAPLQHSHVGVASGIRWYAPRDANTGTLVRAVWNAAAVVQMLALEIAWGGSIALSRQVFENPLLIHSWSKMMWDDTGLKSIVSRLRLGIAFAPAATMVNQESISFRSCFHFITRQLMNVRFYHSHWPAILAVGMIATISKWLLVCQALIYLSQGNWLGAGLVAAVLLFASGCIAAVLFRVDLQVRKSGRARGEELPRLPLKTIIMLWLTIYVYCAALLAALRTKTIQWRGVIYQISPPHQIQITHYEPYQQPAVSSSQLEIENTSL